MFEKRVFKAERLHELRAVAPYLTYTALRAWGNNDWPPMPGEVGIKKVTGTNGEVYGARVRGGAYQDTKSVHLFPAAQERQGVSVLFRGRRGICQDPYSGSPLADERGGLVYANYDRLGGQAYVLTWQETNGGLKLLAKNGTRQQGQFPDVAMVIAPDLTVVKAEDLFLRAAAVLIPKE
jgi:hypothetical protein